MATESPVLFLVFNRPDVTKQTWEAIRAARPKKLYIAADGARTDRPEEKKLCEEVRAIFENSIDWPCDVKKDFRDRNLGCKHGVSSAISWFFQNEEQGIILEDDCLPTQAFFKFCDEMLEKYKDNNLIMQISGSNYVNQQAPVNNELSYYVSTLNDIWGWATWKRAWLKYSLKLKNYDEFKKNQTMKKYFKNNEIATWMNEYIESCDLPVSKVWSTQWTYCMIQNDGYTIAPTLNLVQNVGIAGPGTNNSDVLLEYQSIKAVELKQFNLKHPEKLKIRYDLDKIRFKLIRKTDPQASAWRRLRIKLSRILKKS